MDDEDDWNHCLPTDYERDENGNWLFQEEAFTGTKPCQTCAEPDGSNPSCPACAGEPVRKPVSAEKDAERDTLKHLLVNLVGVSFVLVLIAIYLALLHTALTRESWWWGAATAAYVAVFIAGFMTLLQKDTP